MAESTPTEKAVSQSQRMGMRNIFPVGMSPAMDGCIISRSREPENMKTRAPVTEGAAQSLRPLFRKMKVNRPARAMFRTVDQPYGEVRWKNVVKETEGREEPEEGGAEKWRAQRLVRVPQRYVQVLHGLCAVAYEGVVQGVEVLGVEGRYPSRDRAEDIEPPVE